MNEQTVNSLVMQVEGHFHGPARDQILAQLEQAPNADTVAKITYETAKEISAQAKAGGSELEVDVLLPVATEIIDMLIEMMEAMGVQISPDEIREEGLIKALLLHMQAVEDDPEEVAAAQELLKEMAGTGVLEQSMNYINQRADASPEQMQAAGVQIAAPKQKPLAEGVQRGLMQ